MALVKAHVIPEAFFREIRDERKRLLLIAGAAHHYPKRAPIGLYDRGILCSTCEGRFAPLDTYGADILLRRFEQVFHPYEHEGNTIALSSDAVDANRILQFLVSVLWRASVSKEAFFHRVQLGPLEVSAREAMFSSLAEIPATFDAVLSRWAEANVTDTPATGILNPHRERWDGVNAYRIYLGHVVAYVKADDRPFNSPFNAMSLRAAPPAWVLLRNFHGSKDMAVMKRTAMICELNTQNRRGA